MVEIGGGRRLFVRRRGAGTPTVLFEAGIAASSLNWQFLQDRISQLAGTMSYDRCGLGWSGPCSTVRTPGNVAMEFHALLDHAGAKPPYVLVGHSFGGLAMRRFALLYPDEVAAIVLIDPMRCEEWPPLNPGKLADLARGQRMCRYAVPIAQVGLARLGLESLLLRDGLLSGRLARLAGDGTQYVLGRVRGEIEKLPREMRPEMAALWSRPAFYRGVRSHLAAVPETVMEMADAEPVRGTPVLVLTPGRSTPLSADALRQIGDNVLQLVVPDSAHWIHLDQPEIVFNLIREVVASAQSATMATK